MGVKVFLFAHQDDEFGVYYEIEQAVLQKSEIACIYTTDGGYGGKSPNTRNYESESVLKKLGVPSQSIYFIGQLLKIPDGKLYLHTNLVLQKLSEICQQFKIETLFLPAWEGGHQDHDALHLVGMTIAHHFGIIRQTYQYALYSGAGLRGYLFKVLSPLAENGETIKKKIPWRNRIKYLQFCLSYPSQFRTWLALFPFVLVYYLFVGEQRLQATSLLRIQLRPHQGELLYERRGFLTYDIFKQNTLQLLNWG